MLAAILASGASAMPSSGTTQSLPGRRELVGTPYAATRLQGQNRHVDRLNSREFSYRLETASVRASSGMYVKHRTCRCDDVKTGL